MGTSSPFQDYFLNNACKTRIILWLFPCKIPVCWPLILASRAGAVKEILNLQHTLPLLLILRVVEISVVIVHLLVRKNSLCGVHNAACSVISAGGVRRASVVGKADSRVDSTTQFH